MQAQVIETHQVLAKQNMAEYFSNRVVHSENEREREGGEERGSLMGSNASTYVTSLTVNITVMCRFKRSSSENTSRLWRLC